VAAPTATPIAPPRQGGKGNGPSDWPGQDGVKLASKVDHVLGGVGPEVQGARGRVLLGGFFFAPLSGRRARAFHGMALGAMAIPQE
jgi:hypothetical protein